jgi:hypothetical protein
LPNGPLDIRRRALAQADLVEPIGRAGENLLRWAVFGSEVACKRCRLSAGTADQECFYYFFMVVVMLSIDVHCPYLVNDTITIAVWTSF